MAKPRNLKYTLPITYSSHHDVSDKGVGSGEECKVVMRCVELLMAECSVAYRPCLTYRNFIRQPPEYEVEGSWIGVVLSAISCAWLAFF